MIRATVDAIVDVDFVDMLSFSDMVLVLDRYEVFILCVVLGYCARMRNEVVMCWCCVLDCRWYCEILDFGC